MNQTKVCMLWENRQAGLWTWTRQLAATLSLFQPGRQIMPTLCPHQVLKVTGAPVLVTLELPF